jgi:hypothetical protein
MAVPLHSCTLETLRGTKVGWVPVPSARSISAAASRLKGSLSLLLLSLTCSHMYVLFAALQLVRVQARRVCAL